MLRESDRKKRLVDSECGLIECFDLARCNIEVLQLDQVDPQGCTALWVPSPYGFLKSVPVGLLSASGFDLEEVDSSVAEDVACDVMCNVEPGLSHAGHILIQQGESLRLHDKLILIER